MNQLVYRICILVFASIILVIGWFTESNYFANSYRYERDNNSEVIVIPETTKSSSTTSKRNQSNTTGKTTNSSPSHTISSRITTIKNSVVTSKTTKVIVIPPYNDGEVSQDEKDSMGQGTVIGE